MGLLINGQVGWRAAAVIAPSTPTLWTSVYAVYNADATGSSSLNTSLFAAYNGESNANDSFGSNNGTAVGGLTYGTGKIGNAFTFNGTNSYVGLPNNSFKFNSDFSISLWSNLGGTASDVQALFSNLTYDGTYAYGYYLYYYNNVLTFQISNNSGSVLLNYATGSLFNSWKNIVITRKYSTGTKMYVDGVLVASNTNTQNPNYHATMTPSIGATNYGPTYSNLVQYYTKNTGKIDALNVWNKELTQSEITELYNSGNGAQYITDNFYKPTPNDALNTYNGTAQGGLTYGVGKVGTAFQFNGTNSYVGLPDNSLNLTGPYSISMWVYFATDPSSLNGFYFMNAYNTTAETGFEYRVRFGKPEIGFFTSGGLYTYWYAPNVNITSAGWYNLTLVKPLNQQPQLYLNGSSTLTSIRISNSTVTEVTYTSPVKCSIGNNITLLANYMPNGSKIDALNVWNKELSASEITELYNSGNGKQYPN